MENIQPKPVRIRAKPNKKWTASEEMAMMHFLMDNKEIEKPTAQIYYRRFAEEKNTPVDWKLARTKVRNLRMCYNKAIAWEGSTGAGSMDGETVKSTLLKMCRFFEELDDICGSKFVDAVIIEDSLDVSNCSIQHSTTASEHNATLEFNEEEIATTSICSPVETQSTPASSRKGIYTRTAVSDIMRIQEEAMKLKKQKIDQELIIKEKEIHIKEREVTLNEKEMELKEKEMLSQERLKILELVMKERLAMAKLKLKYNH